jgi:segregation and condensation protein A
LIEERRLEITRVSLAMVTDQFIAYLATMPQRHPKTIAHFLSVAARLLLIKSRALLPQVAPAPEEDDSDAEALVAQLRAYQAYKQVAAILRAREQQGLRSYAVHPPPLPRPQRRLPLDNVTLEALAAAMQRVVNRWLPPPEVEQMVSRLTFTVDDCIARIRSAVQSRRRVSFDEIIAGMRARVEVVVSLLALLELLKRHEVRCYQERLFGEIVIEYFPEEERPALGEVEGDR